MWMGKRLRISAVLALCLALAGCRLAEEADMGTYGGDTFVGVAARLEWGEEGGIPAEDWEDIEFDEVVWDGDEGNATPAVMDSEETLNEIFDVGEWLPQKGDMEQYPLGEQYMIFYFEDKDGKRSAMAGSDSMGSDYTSWFSDIHMSVNASENKSEYMLEGTIYITGGELRRALQNFEANLVLDGVYQRPDATLYTRHGSLGGFAYIDGYTQTVSEEIKVNNNGEEKTVKMSFAITLAQMEETVSVRLLEFDENNAVIAEREIKKPENPDEEFTLSLAPETAYAMLERSMRNLPELGEIGIVRSICNPPFDGEVFSDKIYYADADGMAEATKLYLVK